jgi:hypothetical protein
MAVAPGPPPATRPSDVAVTIVGAILALMGAVALLVACGLAIAQLTLRDDDGYYTSPSAHLTTPTAAIVGDELSLGDVDDGAAADVVDALSLRARITATRSDGGEVFVGIGPAGALRRYLSGVPQAQVEDVRDGDVILRERLGARAAGPPAAQTFWAASAQGPGRQQLDWKPTNGQWAAVVMNATATPGIDVQVRVGARIGVLRWITGGIGAVGLILVAGGGGLMFAGLRRLGQPDPLGS